MCNCKDCRFGIFAIDFETKDFYCWCTATDEIISYEAATDNDLGCDLHVEKLDDHKTEES